MCVFFFCKILLQTNLCPEYENIDGGEEQVIRLPKKQYAAILGGFDILSIIVIFVCEEIFRFWQLCW